MWGFPLSFGRSAPGDLDARLSFSNSAPCAPPMTHRATAFPTSSDRLSLDDLLRRTRLDELPQLYNVLIGEMSFVGPRPLLPVDQPVETSARLLVRPGLTGLAQVRGGRNISPEDKNALDIWYVRNASLWLDIKILLQTPIVMIEG